MMKHSLALLYRIVSGKNMKHNVVLLYCVVSEKNSHQNAEGTATHSTA